MTAIVRSTAHPSEAKARERSRQPTVRAPCSTLQANPENAARASVHGPYEIPIFGVEHGCDHHLVVIFPLLGGRGENKVPRRSCSKRKPQNFSGTSRYWYEGSR